MVPLGRGRAERRTKFECRPQSGGRTSQRRREARLTTKSGPPLWPRHFPEKIFLKTLQDPGQIHQTQWLSHLTALRPSDHVFDEVIPMRGPRRRQGTEQEHPSALSRGENLHGEYLAQVRVKDNTPPLLLLLGVARVVKPPIVANNDTSQIAKPCRLIHLCHARNRLSERGKKAPSALRTTETMKPHRYIGSDCMALRRPSVALLGSQLGDGAGTRVDLVVEGGGPDVEFERLGAACEIHPDLCELLMALGVLTVQLLIHIGDCRRVRRAGNDHDLGADAHALDLRPVSRTASCLTETSSISRG